MRRLVLSLLSLAILGCGGGDPPKACGDPIPQVTVGVGESETVDGVCFEDPEGGALTLSTTVGDSDIASAGVRGGKAWVEGKAPGTTKVTVTATDPDSLTGNVEFEVLVTNEPPTFTGAITEDAVGVGRFGIWGLYSLFEEPGGEEMTFAATSDFPGLIVTLTDSLAAFTGASAGQARVTLTATDPHGAEGSGTIPVTVWEPEVVFDDEFDSDASLDDWEAASANTELAIVDGALVVSTTDSDFFGIAERSGEGVDEYYLDITTRISTGVTGAIWFASSSELYRMVFGRDGNDSWEFHRWRGGDDGWGDAVGEGNSSLIALDRYRTYSIVMYDRAMQLLADGQPVETVVFDDFTATTTIDLVWLIGVEDGTEYDRAQIRGRPGSTSHHDTADRNANWSLPRELHERLIALPPVTEQR